MADIPTQVEDTLVAGGDIQRVDKPTASAAPIYKVFADSKIPVASSMGKLWKSRRDAAKQAQRRCKDAWDESIKYYNHDQLSHRVAATGRSGNSPYARRRNEAWSETENIVFQNANALIPAVYNKNPKPEFNTEIEAERPFAQRLEKLITTLSNRTAAPGLALKNKAKRGVLTALLTNEAWIEIGWTFKDNSSDEAVKQLSDLAKKLEGAKDQNEIRKIEGELQALEQKIDMLQPEGPWCKLRMPHDVLIDPDAREPDLSDANWIMIRDVMSTSYLRAVYTVEDGDGKPKSIFAPTHVLPVGDKGGVDEEVNNFTLLGGNYDFASYGYDSREQFDAACRTVVWWVWDKTTRRLYLCHDQDWEWPVWAWDDKYRLDTFFPVYGLHFHHTPDSLRGKGEVTYYLDQQDAINEIHDEWRRARQNIKNNVMYDLSKATADEVQKMLKGPDGTAIGIKLSENAKMSDVFWQPEPHVVKYPQVFDATPKLQAADRISGVTNVIKGAEFKTNTTNKAIENYNATTNMRVDEKIDSVEDWLSAIYWGVAQLCLQFMPAQMVDSLIGPAADQSVVWTNKSPTELRFQNACRVATGSTQKPTSQMKKEEALQMGQVLGQFVNASPYVLVVMLKVFEQAFDEVVMTDSDWKTIIQSVMQRLQADAAGPSAEAGGDEQPASQGRPQGQQQPQQGAIAQMVQRVSQIIDKLPPEAKKAIGIALSRGAPLDQTISGVMNEMRNGEQVQ